MASLHHQSSLRTKAERRARQLGVEIRRSQIGISAELTCEAPTGKVWRCHQIHELIEAGFVGQSSAETWDHLYKALIEDMEMGVEDCTDPECEWCNEETNGP